MAGPPSAPRADGLDDDLAAQREVRQKVHRAATAFAALDGATQEDLDRIVRAMAKAGSGAAESLARLAVEETGYGVYEDKVVKNLYNTEFVADWMLQQRTKGVLWVDEPNRVTAIGTPMGVIAGLIPVTNPTSTVLFKSLAAVKAGNTIVHAPHPRAVRCSQAAAEVMADAALRAGAPEGVVECLTIPDLSATGALMSHDDVSLVLATGGGAMVRAAYRAGKPCIAVGPGNVPAYVDASVADPAEAAEMIIASKSFDNGTACVAEQSIVAHRSISAALGEGLVAAGLHWMDHDQASALERVLFTPRGGLDPDNVGQRATVLADRAGFAVPDTTRALGVRLDRVGVDELLSREILGPVLSVYEVDDVEAGYARAREVLALDGEGHTVAIHAEDPIVQAQFSRLPAGRLVVNSPALFGGMGFSCAMDPSFQIGTGTWSGSMYSDNITPLHLINIKRLAHEVRPWRSVRDIGRRR